MHRLTCPKCFDDGQGPVVWDTCGNGMSLRQHVGRVAGRSVPEAKGRLISGLDLMARHWSLGNG